jgi:hypothetical protein
MPFHLYFISVTKPYLFESIDFVLGSALASRNNGASVSHSAAGRRSQSSDERNHGFGIRALHKTHIRPQNCNWQWNFSLNYAS